MTLIRCVDLETTGLDPAVHRVCEVATVDVIIHGSETDSVDLDRGKDAVPKIERGKMWSSLVNPGIPIPPEASAVHDITDEMVKDAPMMADVYEQERLAAGAPDYYCAHNSRFDEKFIALKKPVIDTYRVALWLWQSAPEHKLATLRYWLKLNLVGVGPQARGERAHTALWDAYVCAAVLRRAFMAGATVEQMLEVSNQPALLPRLTFGEHAMKPIEEVPDSYLRWAMDKIRDNEDVRHTAAAELQRRRRLDALRQGGPVGPVSTKYDGPQDISIGD